MIEINTHTSKCFEDLIIPEVDDDFFLNYYKLDGIVIKLNLDNGSFYFIPQKSEDEDFICCGNCDMLNNRSLRCSYICKNDQRSYYSKINFKEIQEYELLFSGIGA